MTDPGSEPTAERPAVLHLSVTTAREGAFVGIVRRPADGEEVAFHGVVDLVGAIERLIAPRGSHGDGTTRS